MLVTAHCLPFHYRESSLQGFALQPVFLTYQKWQSFSHQSSLMVCATFFLPSEGAMLHSKCPGPGNRNRKQILYLDLLYSSNNPTPFCSLLYTVGGCLFLFSYFTQTPRWRCLCPLILIFMFSVITSSHARPSFLSSPLCFLWLMNHGSSFSQKEPLSN